MLFNAVSSNFKTIQGGGEKKFEKFVLIIKMLLNIVTQKMNVNIIFILNPIIYRIII